MRELLSYAGPSARPTGIRGAICVILVSAAYYFGAQIGFALQSPNAPQSVLWLPNSILLGVLLITPTRAWPAYLLAAFPAQMLVSWGAGAPPLTLALLYFTNCADAALGAFLVRRMIGLPGPFRFDGLRSTVIFAVGAALATLLLSFADAGISLATGWSHDFSAAFVTRVRSNILTHLIVVPAIIDVSTLEWRRVHAKRAIEAGLLTALLVVTCTLAFARSTGSQAFPALLYLPLPLLLWATARFGPGGTGWGALLVSTTASWNALHGRGPFSLRAPLEEVVSLQLFLLASAIPLLFLGAVIRERNRASRVVKESESALRSSYARVSELAGKLIAAQETERARIARDMHDDFNQQLAALSISISTLRQRLPVEAAELDHALRILQERTVALTEQVRHFSHDLHPGLLNHIGLVPALRTHCIQVAEQQRLDLTFRADDDLGAIPRDVAICLYRIVQEGLRNIVSHAHTPNASVTVARSSDGLELTIADRGRGFEPVTMVSPNGLGLLSIQERARLVGGTLTVTSAHGRGTKLHVHIPITSVRRRPVSATQARPRSQFHDATPSTDR
jgi:two-component system sensor histidine kinase UhpB